MDVLLILGAYLIGSTAFAIFVGKAIARRDAPLAGDHWRFGSGSRARNARRRISNNTPRLQSSPHRTPRSSIALAGPLHLSASARPANSD